MLTMRRNVALLIAGTCLLTACGGDDAAPATPTTTTQSTPATEAGGATFPLTIEHKFGATDIPAAPERVVSVGFNDQDPLLAVGVVPVGIRDWYGDYPSAVWPWAHDELGAAAPQVLSSAEIDFEQIAALDPDLIVGISSGMTDADYDALAAIAPTLAQPAEYPDFGVPWQVQTELIGRAVGKATEAAAAIAETEALFDAARAAHPEFEGASGVVGFAYEQGSVGGYGSNDVRAKLLEALGFVTPPAITDRAADSFFASFSLEEIGLLDADVLVWITGDETAIQQIKDNPLRQQLRAAAEGREVFLSDLVDGGAASFSSVLSLPYFLERLVPRLAAAVDGDPSTSAAG